MTNKQDITVLKSQLEPEKALKERHQQHRATPCVGNAPFAMKPQRGVIRLISFDYALSGLSGLDDIAHPVRRALLSIIQNSKFKIQNCSGLGICATFIPQGVALNNSKFKIQNSKFN